MKEGLDRNALCVKVKNPGIFPLKISGWFIDVPYCRFPDTSRGFEKFSPRLKKSCRGTKPRFFEK